MPSRGYLLCCVQRTGSNLLGQALAGVGIAGRPVEYFNPFEQNKPWMRDILGDLSMVEGLPKILMAGTTPNGLFGAKVHCSHFRYLGMSVNREWDDSQRTAMYELLRSGFPSLLSHAAARELLRSRFSNPTCARNGLCVFEVTPAGSAHDLAEAPKYGCSGDISLPCAADGYLASDRTRSRNSLGGASVRLRSG